MKSTLKYEDDQDDFHQMEDESFEEDEIEEEEEMDDDLNGGDNDGLNEDLIGGNHEVEESDRPAKKQKVEKKVHAPTAEEMNNLKETEALFHSSLFRLQLNEMLVEVKLKEKHVRLINKWIHQFEVIVKSLPSQASCLITQRDWLSSKVPIIEEPSEVKGSFRFEPPSDVQVIGSYGVGSEIKPQTVVDIALEIPEECWQTDDFLNQRYHRKRALYLSYIADQLKKQDKAVSGLSYCYLNGNHMKPILMIKPSGKVAKYVSFALHLHSPAKDSLKLLKLHRYLPEINNVKPKWFNKSTGSETESNPATPIYNSSILQDLTLMANFNHLSKIAKESQSLKDALILMKIWLKQRDMKDFTFVLSLFMTLCLEKKKFSKNSSCYQIFRNTIIALKDSQWSSEGISLSHVTPAPMHHFLSFFPVVFLDTTGYYNLCWEMTGDVYDRLKHEAQLTIQCLDSNIKNSFESTFMKPIKFEYKFDAMFNISFRPLLQSKSCLNELNKDVLDRSGDVASAFIPYLIKLCKKALGNRIELIQHDLKLKPRNEWQIDQNPPNPNNADCIRFGILIDPENGFNILDKGPSGDTQESKDFRAFWGSKSELRRFQDSLVCETVYWNANTLAEKRKIIGKAVEYIIAKFTQIPARSISFISPQFDTLLEMPNIKFKDDFKYGTGEEALIKIGQSFELLSKRLRNIEGLALTVIGVQGTSPVFRRTEVFPSLPLNAGKSKVIDKCNVFDLSLEENRVPKYFKAHEIVINLEGSGKWPDELSALKRVKAAFLIELSNKLAAQFKVRTYATPEHIDVFQDGYVFRIIVASHKEMSLMRQTITPEGLIKKISNEAADELEVRTEIMPKTCSALNGLTSKYLSLSVACRLAKRWIAAQMLIHYFDEIVIELLMANVYLNCSPFTTPNSPFIAFIRFISCICEHNWKTSPLIVNLNDEFTTEQLNEIQSIFTSQRQTMPAMFISTPYDTKPSMWTRLNPSALILNRFIQLANLTRKTILEQIERPRISDFKLTFRPQLTIYDALIRIKREQIIYPLQAIDYPTKFILNIPEFKQELNEKMPITGFNPVEIYLNQLREAYSHFALFFYDQFGGSEIGVLWKPNVFQVQEFKVSKVNACMLVSSSNSGKKAKDKKDQKDNLVINVEAILEDMAIIGQDIVEVIEVVTENWLKKGYKV